MTNKDIQSIAQNEHEFRVQVLTGLAEIKTQTDADRKDLRDLEKCVYGSNNQGGLLGDVRDLKKDFGLWAKGMAVLQALLAAFLAWTSFSK